MIPALRRGRGSRRRRGERGAVALEAALVTPILIALVLGIMEFSFIMRDYVSVSSAVRVGARIASANPGAGQCSTHCTPTTTPYLAQMAADAIQRAGTAMPKDSIDYIFVYQANRAGYPAPGGTASASVPANTSTTMPSTITGCAGMTNCVAYRWLDSSDRFAYQSGTWDTSSVNACPSGAYDLGVYMHVTHRNLTGFYGRTLGMSDRTVMKFEPLTTATCLPASHL